MKRDKTPDIDSYSMRVSRRAFIAAAGGGLPLTASAAAAVMYADSTARAQGRWDREVDVVVVGSGSAGCAAALYAHEAGASTLLLEKGGGFGGTTALSGGIFWIPNNAVMRAAGMQDPREDCIRYFVRTAYSDQYHPDAKFYGIAENEYRLLETLYDEGYKVLDQLVALKCLDPVQWTDWTGAAFPDYYPQLPENKAPRGRALLCRDRKTGKPAPRGLELIGQLKAGIDARKIPVLMRHRATRLVLNSKREVIGLEATTSEGKTVTIRARRGVVFGSGGFTHNRELRSQLRGPVYSGCGPVTNEGDFVQIGGAVGAKLANMPNAWWYPQILELALMTTATGLSGGNSSGDSMLMVNKYGDRVLNEKVRYPDRTQVHFHWDESAKDYRNLLIFMIFDQRTRDAYAQQAPIPSKDASPSWLLSAPTMKELSKRIDQRLVELKDKIDVRLDPRFDQRFAKTLENFNRYAKAGVDPDFHRGETIVEVAGHGPRLPDNKYPNSMMYPLASKGPYYAIMLCGGTLETKGGPKINPGAQVLDWDDKPIIGLYGAGNCIGSPAGQAYWGAGGTIGPALTYGAIAGRNAAAEPVKDLA
jgi:succinate dehydrogenase/fumarate reductase flavoprotein subunit